MNVPGTAPWEYVLRYSGGPWQPVMHLHRAGYMAEPVPPPEEIRVYDGQATPDDDVAERAEQLGVYRRTSMSSVPPEEDLTSTRLVRGAQYTWEPAGG